jgi:3-oxoacyl-[acyl-carrier protein] reductase
VKEKSMSDGQVALVTGASGTIGRAIAAELGARGAALVITGRRKDVLDDVAGALRARGVRVETAVGDVTDPDHVSEVVARAQEAFGPVTTLVNNAGGASAMGLSVADSDPSAWRDTLLANVYGPYLFSRAVLPGMLAAGQGRIITVASRAGTAAIPLAADYVVAKTAVMRLSENIAVETRGTGVVAFSLHPGGVASGPVEEAIEQGKVSRDRFPDPPEAAARMVADLADGKHDVLSGAYLDIHDDLAALTAVYRDEPTRVLRVVDLPADRHARPFSG